MTLDAGRCRKRNYTSRTQARDAMSKMLKRLRAEGRPDAHAERLHVYYCATHEAYHVGHRPQVKW